LNTAIAWVPTLPQIAASVSVSPESFDLVLAPGQSTQRTLEIDSTGPAGSVLNWMLSMQGPQEVVPGGDPLPDPSVTLLSPNGGETWVVGQNRTITWTANAEVPEVRLLVDRGQGYELLAENIDAMLSSWTWPVTGPESAACRIRVQSQTDALVSDASDGVFAITEDYSWIALSEQSGQLLAGESTTVTVTFDATGLETGTYEVNLVLQSSGGAPVLVPVTLLVDTSTAAGDLPATIQLAQNAPNPFNPRTTINFSLPTAGHVHLTVHDLRGRLVKTLASEAMPAGAHAISFDGTGTDGRRLASGTYVYQLRTGTETLSGRMMLVK